MSKAVSLVAGNLWLCLPHKLLSHQRNEPGGEIPLFFQQGCHRTAMEYSSLDRSAFQNESLGRIKLVKASSQEGANGGRHNHLLAPRHPDHRNDLFQEQGIALRR